MPIYGYVCQNCEHTLDALQKVSDDPLVDCPDCGKPELKRQLSAPRFRLKGSGWYETDFKKDKQRNLAVDTEPGKKDDTKESKKDDKKADSGTDGARDKPVDKTGTKAATDAKSTSKSSAV